MNTSSDKPRTADNQQEMKPHLLSAELAKKLSGFQDPRAGFRKMLRGVLDHEGLKKEMDELAELLAQQEKLESEAMKIAEEVQRRLDGIDNYLISATAGRLGI